MIPRAIDRLPSPGGSGTDRAPSAAPAILRYGAYLCMRCEQPNHAALARAPLQELVARFGLENEFDTVGGHPARAVAFLRRLDATPGDLGDDHLLSADVVIHVAAPDASTVEQFSAGVLEMLGRGGTVLVLSGVVRPPRFTGAAMHEFAYARQVEQQSGAAMPNAFLLPMSKTPDWWTKHWMERHTYFLPRYDDAGRMISNGHALAAAAGVSCLMRRTYRSPIEPAPDGVYDFVNYFECADADVPIFHGVCSALRDIRKNPEWKFVREGPTWHGRRFRTWQEMFT